MINKIATQSNAQRTILNRPEDFAGVFGGEYGLSSTMSHPLITIFIGT
ncbi:hypothetical protein N9Y42_11010 [Mariniblastus sp.]|nr:hypothetical protein [Mariniblastus sp.]